MRMRSLCLLTASLTTSPVAAFADPVRIISGERSVGARALANSGDGDEREATSSPGRMIWLLQPSSLL